MRAIAGPACSPRAQPLVASRSSAALRGGQVMSVGYKTSAAAGRRSGLEVRRVHMLESESCRMARSPFCEAVFLHANTRGTRPGQALASPARDCASVRSCLS